MIPGMYDEGPPSYADLETDDRVRIHREVALSKLEENRTYCVHYSSIRVILTSQELQEKISNYSGRSVGTHRVLPRSPHQHFPSPAKPLAQEDEH